MRPGRGALEPATRPQRLQPPARRASRQATSARRQLPRPLSNGIAISLDFESRGREGTRRTELQWSTRQTPIGRKHQRDGHMSYQENLSKVINDVIEPSARQVDHDGTFPREGMTALGQS